MPGRNAARRVRGFLADPSWREGVDLVLVLFDGGRTEGSGVVRLDGPLARPGAPGTIAPADVMPTVLAALGVPASREAAGKPRPELLVPGSATAATVPSWGLRPRDAAVAVDPKEYVEKTLRVWVT